jgi:hypothetical protein
MVYGRVLGALALEVFDVNFLVRHLDPEDGWKPGQAIHNASNIKENSGMKIGTSGDNGDAGMRGMGESSCLERRLFGTRTSGTSENYPAENHAAASDVLNTTFTSPDMILQPKNTPIRTEHQSN